MDEEVAKNPTNDAVDEAEPVEMQLNSNAQPASQASVRATSVYTDVSRNTKEADAEGEENGNAEKEEANNNNAHDEEQQQPPPPAPSSPTTTPQQAATALVLTRVYLAGIPPAKPYRRITYTEWSPSSSSSESKTMIPDLKDVEKKVKTTKCIITSFFFSLAFYTLCFLIIPVFIYICYVIVYVIYQNNNDAEDEPTDDTLPDPQEHVEEAIPCPYYLQQRNECPE
jgi:hypothetical protein